MSDDFGERLTLALKALSMSRGRLASELGVDKSLVGRWASGSVRPSAHNLERLTHLLAAKRPGLTMLDWESDPVEFARQFGADVASLSSGEPGSGMLLPPQVLEAARTTTMMRGEAYEGFWRATHPAVIAPGKFFQEHGIIRVDAGGLLQFRLGGPQVDYAGTLLPIEGQVFAIATDSVRNVPAFLILNIVTVPKLVVMDGLLLTAGNAMRNPSAYPVVLERIGDLSGDREADDATVAELMARPQFIDDESLISEPMRTHLLRDFGPAAAMAGHELLLTAAPTPSLSRIVASIGAAV
ncbi:hypothetical protein DMC47_29900 [Nostoc sp. 3335mG]|nr:hypothetical protein DMC47_29900 [Nostoc sp. 3335mG]